MSEKKLIKLAKQYDDGSGERISLEINQKEKDEEYQVKINGTDGVYCSLEDLIWLRDAIDECFSFLSIDPK